MTIFCHQIRHGFNEAGGVRLAMLWIKERDREKAKAIFYAYASNCPGLPESITIDPIVINYTATGPLPKWVEADAVAALSYGEDLITNVSFDYKAQIEEGPGE